MPNRHRLSAAPARWSWVFSCEHAGRQVPPRWRSLFASAHARRTLESHRGWDPGAAELGERIARHFGEVLLRSDLTRLLIEPNRSLHHPRLFSEFSRELPAALRQWLIDHVYRPHRATIAASVEGCLQASNRSIIHIGFHSFTPVLNGEFRRADVAWLYDPTRPAERAWCDEWLRALRERRPDLQLRRNYPYRGQSDGLTTALRRQFGARYLGIELEINQRWPLGPRSAWQTLQADLQATIPAPGRSPRM